MPINDHTMKPILISILKNPVRKVRHQPIPFESLGFSLAQSRIDFRRTHTSSKRALSQSQRKHTSKHTVAAMPQYAPFAKEQNARPDWDTSAAQTLTKTVDPLWSFGQGATDNGAGLEKQHLEIDPFAEGRSWYLNYTLLISGIVPRPIGFVSTKSQDGRSDNLSPFSYFQVVDHDPPVFVIGFTGRAERPKDTLRNLQETGECTLNVVSEHFIEAVNACSVDAPHGVSEWTLSGLHQAPSTSVKPARVQESIFSIEGKLIEVVDFKTSRPSVRAHGSLAIIEATRFWVREDAIDANQGHIDLDVLRPVAQLGGMSYGRITQTFELPRISWGRVMEDARPQVEQLIGQGEEAK